MTRREDRRGGIEAAGADRGGLRRLRPPAADRDRRAQARPEVVVHELTALPAKLDVREKGVYDANNRIRTEGTRNLVAAAQAAGARRMVAESIAFVYAPVGGPVKSEDDPVMEVEGEYGAAVAAAMELERRVREAEGLEGLVLRYGFFYGPGSSYAAGGHQAEEVRRRRFPIVGGGEGVFSFVHVDDAAAATVAACERGAPGVYNVCDDEPAAVRDWLPAYAGRSARSGRCGCRSWLARMVAGKERGRVRDHAARGLEREGQARARLGARAIRAGARASRRRSDKF